MLAEDILEIVSHLFDSSLAVHFQHYARCLQVSLALLEAPDWPEWNVINWHMEFVRVIGDRRRLYWWTTTTPKLHFLLHMRDQIWKHGAACYFSCLAWERSYKLLKRKKLVNFKNVSHTVTHDRQTCHFSSLFSFLNGLAEGLSFKDSIVALKKFSIVENGNND